MSLPIYFLLPLQKKVAKKSRADFDAGYFLSQPFHGQNRHNNLNLLEHFASNNMQGGMSCLCWTPDAERVLKNKFWTSFDWKIRRYVSADSNNS